MMSSIIAVVALSVLGIAFGQTTFDRELFAVVGASHCAEGLAFGSQGITTAGSADGAFEYYLSTSGTKANQPHSRWLQVVTDGTNELFQIYWTFTTARTLTERFLYATTNTDEDVSFTIVDTGNVAGGGANALYQGSAQWAYSSAAALTEEKLQMGGLSFSSAFGSWGRDNSVLIDGNGARSAASFWGVGRYDGDTTECENIYVNSAVHATSTTTKVYMYVLDDLFAVVGGNQCAEDLRFGASPLSPFGSADGSRYYLFTSPALADYQQQEWQQITYLDGVTESFRITWTFATPRSLANTFATAVSSGVTINYHVVDTAGLLGTAGASFDYTGTWRYSATSGITATRFSISGASFSGDDGAWGASSGVLNGGVSTRPANFWGLGNFNSGDNNCATIYANGASQGASASSVTTMYITEAMVVPTGRPTGQPTSQPTNPTSQPTSQPTTEPTGQPTSRPTGQPSSRPTSQPSSQPSSQPTTAPTRLAKKRRYRLPLATR